MLGRGSKLLTGFLGIALCAFLGYRLFWQPALAEHKKAREELRKTLEQAEVISLRFSDIEAEKKEIDRLRREAENFLKEIRIEEEGIPSSVSSSNLAGEITGRAGGLNIDFGSLHQTAVKERDGYPKLELKMKFSGSYADTVNYLRRIEGISDYLIIHSAEITQSKKETDKVLASMGLSILLSARGRPLIIREENPPLVTIQRDPFISGEAPREKESQFKLSGITWAGKNSTAIIDGKVVAQGVKIGKWEVTSISQGAVTLSHGTQSITLLLNKADTIGGEASK